MGGGPGGRRGRGVAQTDQPERVGMGCGQPRLFLTPLIRCPEVPGDWRSLFVFVAGRWATIPRPLS
jgi:hypothetical protein